MLFVFLLLFLGLFSGLFGGLPRGLLVLFFVVALAFFRRPLLLDGFGRATFDEKLFPVIVHFLQILGQLVRVDVVDSDQPPDQLHPIQVVHGQDGGQLVLVADEGESAALSGLQVSDQVDVDDLAVLAEDADHVPLRQVVREAADEDPGRVLVLPMPRLLGSSHSHLDLAIVHLLQVLHVGDRIHLDADCTFVSGRK